MKKISTIVKLLLALTVLVALPPSLNGQYAVGDTVENFRLSSTSGSDISLFDYQGNVILLNFFTTW